MARRFFTITGVLSLSLLLCHAPLSWAAGEGYAGVIAPAIPEDLPDNNPGTAPDYIPPLSTVSPAPQSSHATARPDSATAIPGKSVRGARRSLGALSSILGADRNGDGVPDDVKAPKIDYSKIKIQKTDGKTDTEYATARQIDYLMSQVNNKQLSGKERQEKITKALESLSNMQNGLVIRQKVPEQTYKKVGFTDAYIADDKAGIASALSLINQAAATLKSY